MRVVPGRPSYFISVSPVCYHSACSCRKDTPRVLKCRFGARSNPFRLKRKLRDPRWEYHAHARSLPYTRTLEVKPDFRAVNFVLNSTRESSRRGTHGATMTSFYVDGRFTDAWVVDRTLFEHLSGVRTKAYSSVRHLFSTLRRSVNPNPVGTHGYSLQQYSRYSGRLVRGGACEV